MPRRDRSEMRTSRSLFWADTGDGSSFATRRLAGGRLHDALWRCNHPNESRNRRRLSPRSPPSIHPSFVVSFSSSSSYPHPHLALSLFPPHHPVHPSSPVHLVRPHHLALAPFLVNRPTTTTTTTHRSKQLLPLASALNNLLPPTDHTSSRRNTTARGQYPEAIPSSLPPRIPCFLLGSVYPLPGTWSSLQQPTPLHLLRSRAPPQHHHGGACSIGRSTDGGRRH